MSSDSNSVDRMEVDGPQVFLIGLEGVEIESFLSPFVRQRTYVHTRDALTKAACRCGQIHATDMPAAAVVVVGVRRGYFPLNPSSVRFRILPAGCVDIDPEAACIRHDDNSRNFKSWATDVIAALAVPPSYFGLICLDYNDVLSFFRPGHRVFARSFSEGTFRVGALTETLAPLSATVGGSAQRILCVIIGSAELSLSEVNELCEECITAVHYLGESSHADTESRDFLFSANIDEALPTGSISTHVLLVL